MVRVHGGDSRFFINPVNQKTVELTNDGLVFNAELRRVR